MSGLTKLGLALLLVFSLSLLGFFAELLYVLWRRRRHFLRSSAASGDPEIPSAGGRGGGGGPASNELLLYFLCWKNQSRVEPASAAASPAFSAAAALAAPPSATTKTVSPAAAEECEMARWRAMCLGPSRVLYTIKEEREEVESDGGMGITGSGDGDEVAETPFSTPCASPPFYTPTSSPLRAVETEADRDPAAPSGGEEGGAVLRAAERV